MQDYPRAADCKFLRSDATLTLPAGLDFIHLERDRKHLGFSLSGQSYALGISSDGWLCGFPIVFWGKDVARLAILRNAAGGYCVFTGQPISFDQLTRRPTPPSGCFTNAYGISPQGAPIAKAGQPSPWGAKRDGWASSALEGVTGY